MNSGITVALEQEPALEGANKAVRELTDLQLALVGGGIGDPIGL